MNELSVGSTMLPPPPPAEGWTRKKLIFFIALALAAHVALIVVFGTKKQFVPRGVAGVPHVQLADNADEFIALGDPTLFARPNAHDLVSAFWKHTPAAKPPSFNWTEPPRYLPPAPEKLGGIFREFMQASQPADFRLNFKPEPKLMAPALAPDDALPQKTTMQISGDLSRRPLLNAIDLPSLPWNDVIAPSKVQALVDTAGNVASAVVLESSGLNDADQRALQLTRNLRFTPAPRLMFGEIIFTWHTMPTNAP
jgi:TonB family protein